MRPVRPALGGAISAFEATFTAAATAAAMRAAGAVAALETIAEAAGSAELDAATVDAGAGSCSARAEVAGIFCSATRWEEAAAAFTAFTGSGFFCDFSAPAKEGVGRSADAAAEAAAVATAAAAAAATAVATTLETLLLVAAAAIFRDVCAGLGMAAELTTQQHSSVKRFFNFRTAAVLGVRECGSAGEEEVKGPLPLLTVTRHRQSRQHGHSWRLHR